MSTIRSRAAGLPRQAGALRLRAYDLGMRRSRERWGFDLNAPDAPDRARAAVASAPTDPAAALLHAAVLASRGDLTEAEAEARRAVQLDPVSARAHSSLSALLIGRGADRDGVAEARRAVELDPTDGVAQYNRGIAEWTVGERGLGRAALRLAARLLNSEAGLPDEGPGWRRIFPRA